MSRGVTDTERKDKRSLATTLLLIGWIAVKLTLVTAMLDRTVTQFIYAGF